MNKQNNAISEKLRLHGSKTMPTIPSSAEEDSYFEPLLQILAHFIKFMRLYQALEEEKDL